MYLLKVRLGDFVVIYACEFKPDRGHWIYHDIRILSKTLLGGTSSHGAKSEISGLLKNIKP